MSKQRRTAKPDWSTTPAAHAAYVTARAEAQARANATGFDHGLSLNSLFKSYEIRMLPQRQNRYGSELMCEVVMCERLEACQPGHGPR